jgi:hypothetical protein
MGPFLIATDCLVQFFSVDDRTWKKWIVEVVSSSIVSLVFFFWNSKISLKIDHSTRSARPQAKRITIPVQELTYNTKIQINSKLSPFVFYLWSVIQFFNLTIQNRTKLQVILFLGLIIIFVLVSLRFFGFSLCIFFCKLVTVCSNLLVLVL